MEEKIVKLLSKNSISCFANTLKDKFFKFMFPIFRISTIFVVVNFYIANGSGRAIWLRIGIQNAATNIMVFDQTGSWRWFYHTVFPFITLLFTLFFFALPCNTRIFGRLKTEK
jgi:hypothetical protein